MKGEVLTAAGIKDAYAGIVKEKKVEHSFLWVVSQHNTIMQKVLKKGSMKNYYTTEKYLKVFLSQQLKKDDVLLKDLTYELLPALNITSVPPLSKIPILLPITAP